MMARASSVPSSRTNSGYSSSIASSGERPSEPTQQPLGGAHGIPRQARETIGERAPLGEERRAVDDRRDDPGLPCDRGVEWIAQHEQLRSQPMTGELGEEEARSSLGAEAERDEREVKARVARREHKVAVHQ